MQKSTVLITTVLLKLVLPVICVDNNCLINGHQHEVVVPKIYHPNKSKELFSTEEQNGKHRDEIAVSLNINGTEIILDLVLNKGLLSNGYFQTYQENGKLKSGKPTFKELNFCQYTGRIRGINGSWAAVSTCNGLNGVIFDNVDFYNIEKSSEKNEDAHTMSKYSNTKKYNLTNDALVDLNEVYNRPAELRSLKTIKNKQKKIFRERNYLELVLVLDNGVHRKLGGIFSNSLTYANSIANIINEFYSRVGIFVALVGVVIWTEKDEIVLEPGETLSNFRDYCKREFWIKRPYDSAQIISSVSTLSRGIGVSYVDTICNYNAVGANDFLSTSLSTSFTVAHELGHNLGLDHDQDSPGCTCPDKDCIMTAVRSGPVSRFSSCSIQQLHEQDAMDKFYCLKNRPVPIPDNSPICGNNIIEFGEECDCGGEICQNRCCNATTCKFTVNSTCATGECCDLKTCQPKPIATTCRPANNECDLPESCNGKSEYCPADTYKLETEICDQGRSYCHHGVCPRKSGNCTRQSGVGYHKNEECFAISINQTHYDDVCLTNSYQTVGFVCGGWSEMFTTCKDRQLVNLQFESKYLVLFSRTFKNRDQLIFCNLVMVSSDRVVQPDVKKCSNEKINCTTMNSIRADIAVCPEDCSGFGWCNNFGQCHCKDGREPPTCYYPGFGGSLTSGYLSDPRPHWLTMKIFFILFLGIITPLAIVVLTVQYYLIPAVKSVSLSNLLGSQMEGLVSRMQQRFSENNTGTTSNSNSQRSNPTIPSLDDTNPRVPQGSTNVPVAPYWPRSSNPIYDEVPKEHNEVIDKSPKYENMGLGKNLEKQFSHVPSGDMYAAVDKSRSNKSVQGSSLDSAIYANLQQIRVDNSNKIQVRPVAHASALYAQVNKTKQGKKLSKESLSQSAKHAKPTENSLGREPNHSPIKPANVYLTTNNNVGKLTREPVVLKDDSKNCSSNKVTVKDRVKQIDMRK